MIEAGSALLERGVVLHEDCESLGEFEFSSTELADDEEAESYEEVEHGWLLASMTPFWSAEAKFGFVISECTVRFLT